MLEETQPEATWSVSQTKWERCEERARGPPVVGVVLCPEEATRRGQAASECPSWDDPRLAWRGERDVRNQS